MRGFNDAALWWRKHCLDCPETHPERIASWTDFASGLQTNFGPVDANQEARDKLRLLHQKGTVKSYVQEFRKLALEANDIPDRELLDWFMQGLKPPLRVELEKAKCLGHCASMAQIVVLAERLDNVLIRSRASEAARVNHPQTPYNPPRYRTPQLATPFKGSPGPRLAGPSTIPPGNPTRESKYASKQCNYCHNLGHTIDECRKRKSQRPPFSNPGPTKVNAVDVSRGEELQQASTIPEDATESLADQQDF